MSNIIQNPIPSFLDTDGSPLSSGSIYFGLVGQNPETAPITVYWDAAGTQPAAQPIKTLNGYPARAGTPAMLYALLDKFSMTVKNKAGKLIFSASDAKSIPTISSSGGSSLIGFIQSGAGAVARTAQDKLREMVSVKDFGAVGDGTTDDTAAIQAALNLGANHSIYFPTGIYISGPLTCGANVTLFGDGWTNSQVKLKAASAGVLLSFTNATQSLVRNLGFNGNYTNCPSGTHAVYVYGTESGGNGFWFEGCGFINAKQMGLYQQGTYTKPRISNCVVESNQGDGMVITAASAMIYGNRVALNGRFGILLQGSYSQVYGNTCNSNGQVTTGGAGIGVVGASFANVHGNVAINNGTGALFTHGIQFNTCTVGTMSGNYSQGNNGSGLDTYISPYSTVSGNVSYNNNLRGIENDTGSNYSTITGNMVIGNKDVGISVFNTLGTVVVGNSVTSNGTGGTAVNPLTGAAGAPYGIALWGAGNYGNYTVVSGNGITQNIGSGANGVGLWVDASCISVTLTGNSFAGNTAQATAIKGNFDAARDNQGLPSAQSGSATLGAAAISVAVTFSPALAFAPRASTIKLAYSTAPFADTGQFSLSGISASGFTINVWQAPGGGGATIDWSATAFA